MTPSRAVKTVAALGCLSSVVWASTFAAFSDTVDAPTGTFTAGSLQVNAEAADVLAFTTLASHGNLKPGQAVYAPLTLKNQGTLAASYTMATTASTGSLPMTVTVRKGSASCSDALGFGAGGTELVADAPMATAAFTATTIAAGASDVLCFKMELPSSAGNAAQGTSISSSLRFSASPA